MEEREELNQLHYCNQGCQRCPSYINLYSIFGKLLEYYSKSKTSTLVL